MASVEMFAGDISVCVAKIQVITFLFGRKETLSEDETVYKNLTLFTSEADFHAEPAIGPSVGLEEGEAAKVMHACALDRC